MIRTLESNDHSVGVVVGVVVHLRELRPRRRLLHFPGARGSLPRPLLIARLIPGTDRDEAHAGQTFARVLVEGDVVRLFDGMSPRLCVGGVGAVCVLVRVPRCETPLRLSSCVRERSRTHWFRSFRNDGGTFE